MALVSDETKTPPHGVFASTPEARQLWDLAVQLNIIAVDLTAIARDVNPDMEGVIARAQKAVAEAEILVHDARRAIRAMARKEE